jgi:ssDNA-binding Zn-finger/Zn-ribbon topoisomerase 1
MTAEETKPKCPKCSSELTIQIANQTHFNSCGTDFALDKNPIGRRARGETEKVGYPKRP